MLFLSHRITFLENINSSEVEKEEWVEKIATFASVRPICDNRFIALEGISFGNVMSEEYFIFTMRFLKEIKRNMRIKYSEQIFEIKRIINDGRGRMLKIIGLSIIN